MDWKNRSMDWPFTYESRLEFPEGWNLSRLLPTWSDHEEFVSDMVAYLGREKYTFELSFIERLQLFVDWLIDRENGVLGCRCYNIRHCGRHLPHLVQNDHILGVRHCDGLPSFLPPKTTKEPNPNRRFTAK